MGPSEIILRVRRRLRDRLVPPRYLRETAGETFAHAFPEFRDNPHRLLTDRTALFFHGFADQTAIAPLAEDILREADRIASGRIELWGQSLQLDDPPVWNRNYFHGGEWPLASARSVDYHRCDLAGGVKYTWEPSRHAFLFKLAQAHVIQRQRMQRSTADYGAICLRWWLDWISRNPVGFGVHWTSPLEAAVRVFVWTWMLHLLRDHNHLTPDAFRLILGQMSQQARFIADNYSFGSSANNHLIGEAAAVAFFCTAFPSFAAASSMRRRALRILEREIARQIHPDGVPAEQAFGYLPFVWEFYLFAYSLPREDGKELPPIVRDRLAASVEFARAAMDSRCRLFQVGDEDEGEVVPFYSGVHSRVCAVGRSVAQLVGADPPIRTSPQDDAYCLWLWGRAPGEGARPTRSAIFREGGYALMRSTDPERLLLFDFGELGLGSLAAHGHSDALQVCLTVAGSPILADSGTFAYHEDPEWRDYFRGTPAHNTVVVAGDNQSEMLGPFLWGRRAETSLAQWVSNDALDYCVAGMVDVGEVTVQRTVAFVRSDICLISDKLIHSVSDDPRPSALQCFTLDPGCAVRVAADSPVWTVENAGQAVQLLCARFSDYRASGSLRNSVEIVEPALTDEWQSPRFGRRVPTKRLSFPLESPPNGGQWLAIYADSELRMEARPYGFRIGNDLHIVLADAPPWRGSAAFLAARLNSRGEPAALCGVGVSRVEFSGDVIFQSDTPRSFAWREVSPSAISS